VIGVLLVDDQALVRAGFRLIVESQPDMEVLGEAADGAEAVELCAKLQPDVVLMDIRMPGLDGVEATRRVTKVPGRGPKVLVLTTFDADEYLYETMQAGASGFLLKDVPPEQLVAGIRMIAAGDALLSPTLTRRLVERFLARPQPSRRDGDAAAALSDREREVLLHVARGQSNAEIAAALFLSEATVKSHLTRILAKLDLRDRVHAVVFAYENGLVRPGG
jgi:DNA-binding NarL/FixJ family response regulator